MMGREFINSVANGKSDIIQVFLDILNEKGSRYCLIGGLVVNAYVEPVVSLDLDIVAAVEDVGDICTAARERGLKIEQFEHSVNITNSNSDPASPPMLRRAGLRIQLQADPRYQKFVLAAKEETVLGYTMKVARLEDVLQGKVWAYMDETQRKSKRQKDLADIFRIIEKFPQLEETLPQTIREELDK